MCGCNQTEWYRVDQVSRSWQLTILEASNLSRYSGIGQGPSTSQMWVPCPLRPYAIKIGWISMNMMAFTVLMTMSPGHLTPLLHSLTCSLPISALVIQGLYPSHRGGSCSDMTSRRVINNAGWWSMLIVGNTRGPSLVYWKTASRLLCKEKVM